MNTEYTVNGKYGLLSKALSKSYREGDWCKASEILVSMSSILKNESKHTDELKALIISFYLDLSGKIRQPFVNDDTVDRLREAYRKSCLSIDDLEKLYFDVIRCDTMRGHSFTLMGTFRIFKYCLLGKTKKIEDILGRF